MEVQTPLPACPFANAGLNSGAMASCPGYEAEIVSFHALDVPWRHADMHHPTGTSCAHLVSAVSRRGHRPACAHPDGLPLEWPVATELRGVPVPRSERVRR